MKTQIAQAKDSVSKIIEAMQKMKIASLPNAAIDVEMAAVAYFDWDTETRKLGRPVVSVFGGREARAESSILNRISVSTTGDATSLLPIHFLLFFIFSKYCTFPRFGITIIPFVGR